MAADNELLIFVGAGAPTSQPIKLESVSASIRNHQSEIINPIVGFIFASTKGDVYNGGSIFLFPMFCIGAELF